MSTMINKAMFAGLIGLSLVACGKKDEGTAPGAAPGSASTTSAAPKIGSCQKLANAGKCTEYPIADDLTGSIQKGGCEATAGKWETTKCPAEKQFANCATSDSTIFFYAGTQAPGSGFTMDEEFAKIDCEMMSGKLLITAKAAAPAATTAAAVPAAPARKAAAAGSGAKPKK